MLSMVVFVCFTRRNTRSCLCKLPGTGEECGVKTGKKLGIPLSWHPIAAQDAMETVQTISGVACKTVPFFVRTEGSSEERALIKL